MMSNRQLSLIHITDRGLSIFALHPRRVRTDNRISIFFIICFFMPKFDFKIYTVITASPKTVEILANVDKVKL